MMDGLKRCFCVQREKTARAAVMAPLAVAIYGGVLSEVVRLLRLFRVHVVSLGS